MTTTRLGNGIRTPKATETGPASLLEQLGIQGDLILLKQVHGTRIAVFSKGLRQVRRDTPEPADGMIIDRPGVFGAIRTADCIPVVAFEPCKEAIALIHAGWRGTAERIVERGLQTLLENTNADPAQVNVALGPCIRSCCYEVGTEVIDAFGVSAQSEALVGDCRLDLIAANKQQLRSLGINAIADAGICTACRTDLFYSYRREKTDKRFWTIAGFRE